MPAAVAQQKQAAKEGHKTDSVAAVCCLPTESQRHQQKSDANKYENQLCFVLIFRLGPSVTTQSNQVVKTTSLQ